MACHNSAERIGPALESLVAQDLDRAEFEVIVVDNGSSDALLDRIGLVREQHPDLSVRYLRLSEGNASLAWNMGIQSAHGLFVTLLDDDDTLAPGTLAAVLDAAHIDEVTLIPIWDVDHPGGRRRTNYVMDRIAALEGHVVNLHDVPVAMSYNAAKVVSTRLAREYAFDPELRSGMDVVYWSKLLCSARTRIRVLDPVDERCGYERTARPDTMSRRLSLRWAEDRVRVIAQINDLMVDEPDCQPLLEQLIGAQAGHLARYVARHPKDHGEVVRMVRSRCPEAFPQRILVAGMATELAILYAFPPMSDASGIVAARRISEHGHIVDVITCDVSALRATDPGTLALAGGYVDRVEIIHTPPVFASWGPIEQFVRQGLERIEILVSAGKQYSGLYSRAMWPAAHVLAAAVKVRHPAIRWRAEFSDPLSSDAQGQPRSGSLDLDSPILTEIVAEIQNLGLSIPATSNLWQWAEHLPYALADEIIFTNPNQQRVMLAHIGDQHLRAHAAARSTVLPHPIPDPALYRARTPLPIIDERAVNLAYFGSFYPNRGIGIVLDALASSPESRRSQIRLHVFSTDPRLVSSRAQELGIASLVSSHPYVDYLDFLSLSMQMDVLIVNDVRTAGTHPVNPYRPSKLSDYLGSGRDIWGIHEPGSPLSAADVTYSSLIGDVEGARRVLATVVEEWQTSADACSLGS